MAASYTIPMIIILLTIGTLLSLDAEISEEEDRALENELKLINKPANVSFRTDYGDTIDCVGIYKQRVFDHPLLKDHKIQKKPETFLPEEVRKGTFSPIFPEVGPCPEGTVPIVRARKEDLLMSKRLLRPANKDLISRISDVGPGEPVKDPKGGRYAVFSYQEPNYGAAGHINVWSLTVLPEQISSASITVRSEQNIIQTGWIVYDYLYNNYSRLYVYWTVDGSQKTGCYNLLCPGFVQTSTKLPLGVVLRPWSEYGGDQYEIRVKISQDKESGNWWLKLSDQVIGYWPKLLLPLMEQGAANIAWGGYIYSNRLGRSPPMGSGHYYPEGITKAAYLSQMNYANPQENFLVPDITKFSYIETQLCYTAMNDTKEGFGLYMLYGGTGGCSFPPARDDVEQC